MRSDGRAGVVWHTQGSGKSMEMELYANQVLTHPSLGNPTIVVLTDRTDLDDQLYDTFQASELLPEKPLQVATREELRAELANKRMGGIVFTTLQKFGRTKDERESGAAHPLLSDRRNIIVIVDEAHRSHYDDLNGYARHLRDALPYATMIAFTGTPISAADRNTARRVRRVHRRLRPDPGRRGRRDGAGVLREPADPARPAHGHGPRGHRRAGRRGDPGLDDSERERVQQRVAAMKPLYGAPAGSASSARTSSSTGRPVGRDAQVHRRSRQGHDRLRHPGHLRPPVRANYRYKAGLALQ